MKGKIGITSEIFDCLTCGKRWKNYINSRQKAHYHAVTKKHHVSGDVTTAYSYNGLAVKK